MLKVSNVQIPCFIVCNLLLAEMMSGQNANRISSRLTTPRTGMYGECLTEGSHMLPTAVPVLPWHPASMLPLGLPRVRAHHGSDKKTPCRGHLDRLLWVQGNPQGCVIPFFSYRFTWPCVSLIARKSPNSTLSWQSAQCDSRNLVLF